MAPTALYALNVQRPMMKAAGGARAYNYSCSFVLIETRSAPALTRCYPRSFTFYLGNPFPRFVVNELRWALNEGNTARLPQC